MSGSEFVEMIRQKASKYKAKIAYPEATDERVLRAAHFVKQKGIAEPLLVAYDAQQVYAAAEKAGVDLGNIEVVDIHKSPEKLHHYATAYQRMRQLKENLTYDQCEKRLCDPLYFSAFLLRDEVVDGVVAGAVNSTANVIRAGLQVIGVQKNIKVVSSIFFMVFEEHPLVPDGILGYSDCGVVPDPDAKRLADIAITSAQSFKKITGLEPRVAFLSFSTYGSASHPMVDKVKNAVRIAKQKASDIVMDGELQVDAALVPQVAKKKAPDSPVAGQANVLIFPDLNAGNIAYKLTERLAGAKAFGPIVQGLAKPMSDLSRGCSYEDIVDVTSINILMGVTN